ncbi:Alpha-tocopherol transfer protein-like [Homarus americanus]|uniref:Alpha-tocopherol transfer protein-like n=1 Tax=Homarus americanus TaxID=6706 RepID=A0A8J5MU03_HOMAM|nr:Alpha-tocopherol transfer protein-like [Homarus americanus]
MAMVVELLLPLDGLSVRGARVVLARPTLRDPNTTDMNDSAWAILLMMEVLLAEDETVAITGVEMILDGSSMTLQHTAQMNLTILKKASTIMQVICTDLYVDVSESQRRVMLARPGHRDPTTTSMDDVARTILLTLDLLLEEDETIGVTGMLVVMDTGEITFQHAAQMTPTIMKKMATLIQEGYPMRPKGLNYINTPAAFDTVFNIFKTFMKEKMKRRTHFHGSDLDSLHKEVPKEVLPVEYGGTNGTIEDIKKYWLQRVDARRDWLIEDEQYGVDESKRPGKAKTSADLFGIEGSFRKLNVD